MLKAGKWWVELDDGTGTERRVELDRTAQLKVGEVLPETHYGRSWRIQRIAPKTHFAVAVPAD